uniref:Uncharacterized protein n=1 Tax=Arundo donax TaxID=35708 RepID=A0A0A9HK12_ARUDO
MSSARNSLAVTRKLWMT